jgi:hypothetical protein
MYSTGRQIKDVIKDKNTTADSVFRTDGLRRISLI